MTIGQNAIRELLIRGPLQAKSFTLHLTPIHQGVLPKHNAFHSWATLATDKYGIAGVFTPHDDVKGFVFIFPHPVLMVI